MELTAKQTTDASRPDKHTARQNPAKKLLTTKNMVLMAMFGALSGVLMYFQFPVPFAPPFYQLDFCDVPVLIGSFALGPVAGMVIAGIKILINLVMTGTSTAGVGEFSNWVQACSLAVPAALIYKHHKSRNSAFLGMAAGVVIMVMVGCFTNAFVMLPVYAAAFHMPIEKLVAMGTAVNPGINSLTGFIMLAVLPFNLLKGTLVSLITALIYKRVSIIIKGRF
ncbi:MAG: ECF transporter S component [Lachnospiraceae bacterium]|nr:ECF transporter S component [Lachnospiraceae bacterium]